MMSPDKEPNLKMTWKAKDLPVTFRSFKACNDFMFDGPL